MSLEKFAPRDIPFQASNNLREYLDNEMRRIQVLLNNAAQLEDELIPDSLLSANVALYNGDIASFSSGTLADARLSSNVALKNAANAFTDAQTIAAASARPLTVSRTNSALNADIEFITTDSSVFAGNAGAAVFNIGPNLDLASNPYASFGASITEIKGATIQSLLMSALSLADDATGTFTLKSSKQGGLLFLTATSTADVCTGEFAILYVDDATSITEISVATGLISTGAGVNPDVDGDINVWSASAGVISVKNRRGASRRIQLVLMG